MPGGTLPYLGRQGTLVVNVIGITIESALVFSLMTLGFWLRAAWIGVPRHVWRAATFAAAGAMCVVTGHLVDVLEGDGLGSENISLGLALAWVWAGLWAVVFVPWLSLARNRDQNQI
jgi:hypothetical protein